MTKASKTKVKSSFAAETMASDVPPGPKFSPKAVASPTRTKSTSPSTSPVRKAVKSVSPVKATPLAAEKAVPPAEKPVAEKAKVLEKAEKKSAEEKAAEKATVEKVEKAKKQAAQKKEVLAKKVEAVAEAKAEIAAETNGTFVWKNTPDASVVEVAGEFDGWKGRHALKKGDDGVFEGEFPLKKGTWAYKFVVDGEWCYDFTAENKPDDAGNVNNVITV